MKKKNEIVEKKILSRFVPIFVIQVCHVRNGGAYSYNVCGCGMWDFRGKSNTIYRESCGVRRRNCRFFFAPRSFLKFPSPTTLLTNIARISTCKL